MKLIIGLGNPGKKYEKTRHNAGFMAVDFLVKTWNLNAFAIKDKFKAKISDNIIQGEKVILAKAQNYMNNSGDAVNLLKSFYKIENANIIVIYDELDLRFGKIRVREDGSSAGHKGIESIMLAIGSDKFKRIRIGIRNDKADKMPADKFVLSRFSIGERWKLKKNILPVVAEECKKFFNKKTDFST